MYVYNHFWSIINMSEVRVIHYRRLRLIHYELSWDQMAQNEWEWETSNTQMTPKNWRWLPRQVDDVYREWHVLGVWSMCDRMRSVWKSAKVQMDWLRLKVENETNWLLMSMRKPLVCTNLSTEPISAGSFRKLEVISWCFFFSGSVTGDKPSITSKFLNLGASGRLLWLSVGTDSFLSNYNFKSQKKNIFTDPLWMVPIYLINLPIEPATNAVESKWLFRTATRVLVLAEETPKRLANVSW